jgi:hypothetical protein
MTPEQRKKWLEAMAAAPGPIEVRVSAVLAAPGHMASVIDPRTGHATLIFHSPAERDVWLDQQREAGMKDGPEVPLAAREGEDADAPVSPGEHSSAGEPR